MGLGGSNLKIPGGGSEGFHVLRVQDGSPGHKAGLEAYFDFIVTINGVRLDTDNDRFKEVLKENVGKPVELLVYSSKTQTVRQLTLIPHENWGGQVRNDHRFFFLSEFTHLVSIVFVRVCLDWVFVSAPSTRPMKTCGMFWTSNSIHQLHWLDYVLIPIISLERIPYWTMLKICSPWSKVTKANRWNFTSTIVKAIWHAKLRSLLTLAGAARVVWAAALAMVTFIEYRFERRAHLPLQKRIYQQIHLPSGVVMLVTKLHCCQQYLRPVWMVEAIWILHCNLLTCHQ